jgi:hypothetical protein
MIQYQNLTNLQKQNRLARGKVLLNELKTSKQPGDIIFSDEKLFTVESKINVQNDRLLIKSSADLPADKQTKFCSQKPASIMVCATISKIWK